MVISCYWHAIIAGMSLNYSRELISVLYVSYIETSPLKAIVENSLIVKLSNECYFFITSIYKWCQDSCYWK